MMTIKSKDNERVAYEHDVAYHVNALNLLTVSDDHGASCGCGARAPRKIRSAVKSTGTNLSCRSRIARYVTLIVLYTKADVQCDKLATVVGRTTLPSVATADEPWRSFSKSRLQRSCHNPSAHPT